MTIAALIVAAGRGTRAGTASDGPKQYAPLADGRAMLAHTVQAFIAHPAVGSVLVVIHADDGALYAQALGEMAAQILPPVTGGATRQASVLAGLRALAPLNPLHVLIHDAARPFVDQATIGRVIDALRTSPAALAGVPAIDTMKRVADSVVTATIPRSELWHAQTPQGFEFSAILGAHERAASSGLSDFTDDAAIAEWAGLTVAIVVGDPSNRKITTRADLEAARAMTSHVTGQAHLIPVSATGFDVHAFGPGDHVMLCGLKIPHAFGLIGHSDADVGLHALTDAILGAIGAGDIGKHFPPSDPRWKGAASDQFLAHAGQLVAEAGGMIAHVDLTLICEAPKIGPHREAMRGRIAEILGVAIDRTSVKATTTEQLGFTGRREGIAAFATATVLKPLSL